MTREEVVEIMNYCKEHKMTYKSRLEELNIPVWRFYDSKSRYAAEQSSGKTAQGEFIELPHSRSFVPVPSFAGTSGRKQKSIPATPSGLKGPDVMPTLAALAGATDKLPQKLNGINILPLFYGQQLDTDNRLLYWEFPGKQRAARRGDWKVVTVKKDAPLELYNIKEDMTESVNLANKYPEKVAQFEKEMKAMRVPTPNWPLPGE